MNDPQVIANLPIDVQLAMTSGDRQVTHIQDSKYKGRTEIVLTLKEYEAMRGCLYGAAERARKG
jgi:hypothetical protein